jgi:hypothetical protein
MAIYKYMADYAVAQNPYFLGMGAAMPTAHTPDF